MKRTLSITALFLFLALAAAPAAFAGEVLDGVVATVNRAPILRSDWNEAVRFEAFMQQKPLADVTDADRAAALRRMIDRQLLQAQMQEARYMRPSDSDLDADIEKLRAQIPGADNPQGWAKSLAAYGLSEAILKDHLRDEVQVMNFLEVRLRPEVKVEPAEIEAYYNQQLLPDLQKTGTAALSLDQVEPKIRELLTQQRIDELLSVWLHNLRQQAEIRSSVPLPEAATAADNGAD
jgi:hypothetical protein